MNPHSLIFPSWRSVYVSLIVLIPNLLNAQGIVYISDLGSVDGAVTIDSSDWWSQGIETGTNAGGYLLNSVQVQMAVATGSPSGFTLSVFSVLNGVPSQSLGILTGSANPASAGVYTYDASALNLTLAPSTQYFLVESATSPSSQGSYEWDYTGSVGTSVDGWGETYRAYSQDSGNDWTKFGRIGFDMAVTATAVPEPSTWVLCLLGVGFALYLHARQRPSRAILPPN